MSGGMEVSSQRLDHSGLNIRIIKATNGTIIEYAVPYEPTASPNQIHGRDSGGQRLYIVPENVKIVDAICAVVGLMKLE